MPERVVTQTAWTPRPPRPTQWRDETLPLRDRLLAFIDSWDHVSLAEVSREFEPAAADREGDQIVGWQYGPRGRPDLVLWIFKTEAVPAALEDLMRAGEIVAVPSSILVYAVDGGLLNLPVARRVTGRPYKRPHWVPVTLRISTRVRMPGAKPTAIERLGADAWARDTGHPSRRRGAAGPRRRADEGSEGPGEGT